MPKELQCYPKNIDEAEKKRLQQLAAEWRKANAWNPHRLRHNAGTRIREAYGVEMARIILGVSSISVATIYAEESREEAHKIMGELG
jgi:integrase